MLAVAMPFMTKNVAQGTEKYLSPPPREQEKKIFRGKLWLRQNSKTISTIAILWAVKAIFEKRAATVEVDTFISPVAMPFVRNAPDTFIFLRHVMRALWSVRPKCSHKCVSLKETPLKPVQILKHTTKNSAEQTVVRTKWSKHIAI